jgi:hypothetical protein
MNSLIDTVEIPATRPKGDTTLGRKPGENRVTRYFNFALLLRKSFSRSNAISISGSRVQLVTSCRLIAKS